MHRNKEIPGNKLAVVEESFKKWAGHAGMLSGYDAACGAGCRKQDTWEKITNLLWNYLFQLYGLQLLLCYAGSTKIQQPDEGHNVCSTGRIFPPYVYHCKVVKVEKDFPA